MWSRVMRVLVWSKSLMAISEWHCQQLINVAMRHKGWTPVKRHQVNRKR